MIDIQHLNKSFKDRRTGQRVAAVRDVSFKAPDGCITALLGPNGAGKTTTLRILSTLMKADGGQAHVGGVSVNTHPESVQATLGLLSDARGLYTRLSARENILYYAALRRIEPAKAQQRLSELAEALDMAGLLDRPTQGFSTGEKMKVALARALIHDPQHLILDEPTNGLDVMSTRALRRLLLSLRSAGKCILFSTHLMQEVEHLSDDIVIISDGRTIAQGNAHRLRQTTASASLEDAFVALATPQTTAPTP